MNFFAVSFVVGMKSHKDVYLLFGYFNGADSYTKLKHIVFAF